MKRGNSKWLLGMSDEGPYLFCASCKHKISAKKILFADEPYNRCPNCNRPMDEISDDLYDTLGGMTL